MSEDLMSEITEDNKMDLPEIYVDGRFLPKENENCNNDNDEKTIFNKVYEINGNIYKDESLKEKNVLQEFAIESVKENVTTDENTDNLSSSQDLEIFIQETPYGIIINSTIFVTENQWHTITSVDCDLKCMVCDISVENSEDHIKLDTHLDNLDKCKPLKKFDFNLTRKIADNYHCVLCNVIFNDENVDAHFDSKEHEEKMLFATNRASDVMFDFNMHSDNENKTNDYHFDRKRLYSVSESSVDESVDGFYEYDMTSNDIDTDSNTDSYNDIYPKKISYANVAKKPAIVPKYVDQVLGDRKVKIKFDFWHMIITPRPNQFYCMVCVGFDHIANKAKHCLDEVHLDKLNKCEIVDKYKEHLIRKLNEKYYHCGNCNTLQYILDIDDHIARVHDKKKSKITHENYIAQRNKNNENEKKINNGTTSKNVDNDKVMNHELNNNQDVMQINRNTQNNYIIPRNINNEIQIITNTTPRNVNNKIINHESIENRMQMNQNTSMNLSSQFIHIYQFHCPLRVSFISYNMVCQRKDDYYCGICNYAGTEFYMKRHIKELGHIERLTFTPFQVYFGINLIRLLNKQAHCTICNVVFEIPLLNAHIIDQTHRMWLKQAIIDAPNHVNYAPTIQPVSTNQRAIESKTSMNQSEIDMQEMKIDVNESNKNESILHKSNENETIGAIESKTSMNQSKNDMQEMKIDVNESNENETVVVEREPYNGEYIYLKLKNTYIKVTYKSYNSLISIGDGSYYCFVCSKQVFGLLQEHIEDEKHINFLGNCHFIEKYDKHLLRQISCTYHCCNCNIMLTKRELPTHMTWPRTPIKLDKKIRKNDFKSGVKQITIKTKKELILSSELEPKIEILAKFDFKSANKNIDVKKTSKIIIFNGDAYKISWDDWQGLCKNKNGYRCSMCQKDVKNYEINNHISDDNHKNVIENTFEKKLLPSLFRKINENILNCVICNMEVLSRDHVISEHIKGKRHKKNLNNTKYKKAKSNSDKNEDILYL